jgi:16S rRNA processing protein RimM
MPENPDYLVIGEILRPHGVRGEVRLRILTAYPERIAKLKTVYLGDSHDAPDLIPYQVEANRMSTGYGLLKLKGIEERNAADRLRGLFVMVDFAHAVPLEEGEFYLYQLIGIRVFTDDGLELGTLVDVLETGANDVYVINSPEYGEVLIPVIPDTILSTDIAQGILTVHLLEGLLPPKTE